MSDLKNIPKDWQNFKLKHLLSEEIKNGYSPICPDEPNGNWILSLGNLTDNGFDVTQVKPAPKNDLRIKDFILKSGDFLISRSNTLDKVGRTMLFRGELENCSYPDLLMKFRVNEALVFKEFLERSLKSSNVRKHIQSCAAGTSESMVKINKTVVENIPIILPPLPEQKAIADLLATWDEAIEKTDRLIKAKERKLDAYAANIFDRKLKGKYDGWKEVKLKELLSEHGDKSSGFEEVCSVSVSKGVVNQVEHLGRVFSSINKDNYNCVHFGDIVYTKSPTGDFPLGIVKQSYLKQNVIVSPLYGVFTPNNFNIGAIIDHFFSSPVRARNYLSPIIQKGAKNTIAITNNTFLSNTINLPVDEQIQNNIAEYILTAKAEIKILKQLSEKYKLQKRGLMQKLLTGTWRIKPDVVKQFEVTI